MKSPLEEGLRWLMVFIIMAWFIFISGLFIFASPHHEDINWMLIAISLGVAIGFEYITIIIYALIGIRNRIEDGNKIQLAQTMINIDDVEKSPASKMLIKDSLKKML